MNYTILLIITSIVALLPIFLIKKYINTKIKSYLFLAGFFYLLLLLSYIEVFSHAEVTSAYTLLQILQVLIIVLGGIFIFKENLNFNKIIGIISGVICIYFLTKF
jgi:drug/metabolite transporter (DMT)-like permease